MKHKFTEKDTHRYILTSCCSCGHKLSPHHTPSPPPSQPGQKCDHNHLCDRKCKEVNHAEVHSEIRALMAK